MEASQAEEGGIGGMIWVTVEYRLNVLCAFPLFLPTAPLPHPHQHAAASAAQAPPLLLDSY